MEPPPQLIEVKEEVESSEEEQEDGVFECRKCGQRFESKGKDTNMEVLKKLHQGSCRGGKEPVEKGESLGAITAKRRFGEIEQQRHMSKSAGPKKLVPASIAVKPMNQSWHADSTKRVVRDETIILNTSTETLMRKEKIR